MVHYHYNNEPESYYQNSSYYFDYSLDNYSKFRYENTLFIIG